MSTEEDLPIDPDDLEMSTPIPGVYKRGDNYIFKILRPLKKAKSEEAAKWDKDELVFPPRLLGEHYMKMGAQDLWRTFDAQVAVAMSCTSTPKHIFSRMDGADLVRFSSFMSAYVGKFVVEGLEIEM